MRRRAILAAMVQVSDVIIHLKNRWRKREGAKGADPGLNRHQTYTQMRSMVPKMRLYSEAQ